MMQASCGWQIPIQAALLRLGSCQYRLTSRTHLLWSVPDLTIAIQKYRSLAVDCKFHSRACMIRKTDCDNQWPMILGPCLILRRRLHLARAVAIVVMYIKLNTWYHSAIQWFCCIVNYWFSLNYLRNTSNILMASSNQSCAAAALQLSIDLWPPEFQPTLICTSADNCDPEALLTHMQHFVFNNKWLNRMYVRIYCLGAKQQL